MTENSLSSYPTRVQLTDVGLRDGLQMESEFVSTGTKIELANSMIRAGVTHLEITSFVSPRAVPQLSDAAEVIAGIDRTTGAYLSALAPNQKGVERALSARVDSIVMFVSASESHNGKNLNRSIHQSLQDIREAARLVRSTSTHLQGAIAVAFGCPFEGNVPLKTLLSIVQDYLDAGFHGITLGDTTGMATPLNVKQTIEALRDKLGDIPLTLHFHNTRGLALANMLQALQLGIRSFESSLGGIGGCPFAPGATGNVSTEDAAHMLQHLGVETGVDLHELIRAALRLEQILGRPLPGQVMRAGDRLRRYELNAQCAAVG
ncbi:hydroxymethylglutaryl-CoA lyase [Paraburkholderia sp. Tr-20389]|uniref:hydroxymethylglutaryl-CoA lyase n=1 Tax=Paraburkholderia sp. Tr-20389 TaxID=2703903 RepID=UPI00197ED6FA|nr:hydroxymethylglutaryl-CoA lyase [Paraburkholderia sp. Tr-20389]